MNVLYVAGCEFASNIAMHPLSVARVMSERGIHASVAFRSDDNNVRPRGSWPFTIVDQLETGHNGVLFPDGRGPDLIHAWTPRENVRRLTERMVERHGCPYIVHLEDNEDVIARAAVAPFDYSECARLPARLLDAVVPPDAPHPRRFRRFIEGAAGVTALIDRLMEFKPEHIPGVVFWPGSDAGVVAVKADRAALLAKYGIPPQHRVLVYNGNIHASNADEVMSLVRAAGLLSGRGIPLTLIKTGANHAGKDALAEAARAGYLLDLGFVAREEIYALLQLADVLVQPGRASGFNDYRFPCKLPEFLAAQKAVVLPKSNLGRYLRDGVECLLLERGDAEEIADKVELLLSNPELRRTMGEAGSKFAHERLDWSRNLEPVVELYKQVLERPARPTVTLADDSPPVALSMLPDVEEHSVPYLAMAVKGVAEGDLTVHQGSGDSPALYEKWLAATVEHAMRTRAGRVEIRGSRWPEATERAYARGMANYLREAGMPITDAAVENALRPAVEPTPRADWKTASLIDAAGIENLISRYAGKYPVAPVSYATVRDYCDSVDHMRCLATIHGDLKNVQRPWMVKAVLGVVPRGGRLLEIGAGEPWIADILTRAGYEVWIADPYDGSGNGPQEFAKFLAECPEVRFIRDVFSDRMADLPPEMFDCIYSVSVLEHVDAEGLRAIARGQQKFLKTGGHAIHAIDHVLRGEGEVEDLARLQQLCADFGLNVPDPAAIERDLDTYYLSAEGLNQWRGRRAYELFPMRKWIGVQLSLQKTATGSGTMRDWGKRELGRRWRNRYFGRFGSHP